MSPGQWQAIIWTNGIFLIWSLGTNFNEIIEIHNSSFKKIHFVCEILVILSWPHCVNTAWSWLSDHCCLTSVWGTHKTCICAWSVWTGGKQWGPLLLGIKYYNVHAFLNFFFAWKFEMVRETWFLHHLVYNIFLHLTNILIFKVLHTH